MARLAFLVAFALIATDAIAQQLDCRMFRHNPDGSWSPVAPVTISGPKGQVQIGPGASFDPGDRFMELDLGAALNAQCP